MKVFLLSDYFYPFNPGGSEWSVYELGQSLKKEGLTPLIVTLNYGAAEEENYHGMKILRLPFYKKLKSQRQVVNPIWQNNPIFFLTSAFHLIKAIRNENPDLLHVHGKFLIPPAIIASFITKKPPVAEMIKKAIGREKGSQKPGFEQAGTLTRAQAEEIAKAKMEDLNTDDLPQATRIVEGTARSMGIKVE